MKTVADDPRNPHLDEERLNDFVDQLLSEVAEAQVRRHLDACAACRAEVAELRALLDRTAGLPLAVTPPRDLWTGIRERCAGEDAPSSRHPARPRLMALPSAPPRPRERHPLVRYWLPLAAAAVALIVMSSSITNVLMKPGGPFATRPGTTAAPSGSVNRVLLPRVAQPAALTSAVPGSAAVPPTLGAAEQTFERAAADLRTAFEARKGQLKPKTVATVEENLVIIDDAIRRARAALEADPGNSELNAMVNATWQKKVELLEKAVRLSSEI